MPDSYGKRQRSQVKARKAAAREERRLDRNRRQADRAAGITRPADEGSPPEAEDQGAHPDDSEAERPTETSQEGQPEG